jgi:hypothetical protein
MECNPELAINHRFMVVQRSFDHLELFMHTLVYSSVKITEL